MSTVSCCHGAMLHVDVDYLNKWHVNFRGLHPYMKGQFPNIHGNFSSVTDAMWTFSALSKTPAVPYNSLQA